MDGWKQHLRKLRKCLRRIYGMGNRPLWNYLRRVANSTLQYILHAPFTQVTWVWAGCARVQGNRRFNIFVLLLGVFTIVETNHFDGKGIFSGFHVSIPTLLISIGRVGLFTWVLPPAIPAITRMTKQTFKLGEKIDWNSEPPTNSRGIFFKISKHSLMIFLHKMRLHRKMLFQV